MECDEAVAVNSTMVPAPALGPVGLRLGAVVAAGVLLTACSASEGTDQGAFGAGESGEEVLDLEHRAEVSEVAWQWEAPEESTRPRILAVPGGVAALLDDGVVGLSGETGGPMWQFRVPGDEAYGSVSDDGRSFVLQILDPDDESAPPRMVVLDTATGEPREDYPLSEGESSSGLDRGWLGNVTDEHWVTVDGDEDLAAYALGSDEKVWSVPNVAECEDVGSVDALVTEEGVTVAAFTCYVQPEGEDTVEMTENQEFVSGFAGFDPATGEELWRTEATAGLFPADAHERDLEMHPSGLVTAYYSYIQVGQVVDPATGEVETLEGAQVLWSSADGSHFGVWDWRTRGYRVQDLEGEVRSSLGPDEVGAGTAIVNALRGGRDPVGLENGLLHMAEQAAVGPEETDIAAFQGTEGTVPVLFTGEEETVLDFGHARSVPGAVVLSYTDQSGAGGVIGLR